MVRADGARVGASVVTGVVFFCFCSCCWVKPKKVLCHVEGIAVDLELTLCCCCVQVRLLYTCLNFVWLGPCGAARLQFALSCLSLPVIVVCWWPWLEWVWKGVTVVRLR